MLYFFALIGIYALIRINVREFKRQIYNAQRIHWDEIRLEVEAEECRRNAR